MRGKSNLVTCDSRIREQYFTSSIWKDIAYFKHGGFHECT